MSRLFRNLFLVLTPLLFPVGADADVYKYVDRSGHVYYTDNPRHSGFQLLIRTPEPFSEPVRVSFMGGDRKARGRKTRLNPYAGVSNLGKRRQYAGIIAEAASQHGLDPALLDAVIRAESAYNPGAVSHKGAMGLMQLMPATAARYGVRDPYDPEENISGGAKYLSELLDLFQSDVALAVAAYNAGENNVIKYGNQVPPFQETRNYVSKVLNYYYN